MRIQCDACEAAAAAVVCCADEAALCARCDVEIHAANKLASKHQRLPLGDAAALPASLPRCDVCQERPAFIFCKDSSLGLKELEWFEDIDLFHAHSPAKTAMAEFFASPQPVSNAGFYKANGARLFKKSRMEVPDDDDEDYFIVPDLG
ncbi:Salt tolerance-like protein [Zea mays]|uniref:Salt tolerance-like protein n=1 Tax=Zea mays TaxID=4577 RepID=A0A1D6E7C3_MAIZE|nr:Salt tolerance-like protein [Zea mays]